MEAKNLKSEFKSCHQVSPKAMFTWKILQLVFWVIGLTLLMTMILVPALGLTLFWNVLIPIAPALLVIATGVWRNVCPLGTTALLPDKAGYSKKLKLDTSNQSAFNLVGVILLLLIIPLRHVLFDRNGAATAIILIVMAAIALLSGIVYERKSAWCSGLCPVHPVEKLYGSCVAYTLPNTHCNECVKCSVPCPDSTLNVKPFLSRKTNIDRAIEIFMVGGFPGYIWGWFHVPDYKGLEGWQNLHIVYGYPILGAAITISIYILSNQIFDKSKKAMLVSLFASAAVSCYYWFRIPLLLGFGSLQTNGVLLDLSQNLPHWSMYLLNVLTTGFFFWWIVFRNKRKTSWSLRPEYAKQ